MAAGGIMMEVHEREDAAIQRLRVAGHIETLVMVPLPDMLRVKGCQRHVATGLALSVEKGVQEARTEPELLEVGMDS